MGGCGGPSEEYKMKAEIEALTAKLNKAVDKLEDLSTKFNEHKLFVRETALDDGIKILELDKRVTQLEKNNKTLQKKKRK